MSGSGLAAKSGVNLDTIRSIEGGRIASPGLYTAARLSNALGVALDELVAQPFVAAREVDGA